MTACVVTTLPCKSSVQQMGVTMLNLACHLYRLCSTSSHCLGLRPPMAPVLMKCTSNNLCLPAKQFHRPRVHWTQCRTATSASTRQQIFHQLSIIHNQSNQSLMFWKFTPNAFCFGRISWNLQLQDCRKDSCIPCLGVASPSGWGRAEGCAVNALCIMTGSSALGGDSDSPFMRGVYCSGRDVTSSSSTAPATALSIEAEV